MRREGQEKRDWRARRLTACPFKPVKLRGSDVVSPSWAGVAQINSKGRGMGQVDAFQGARFASIDCRGRGYVTEP